MPFTTTPARLLGLDWDGVLRVGGPADLLLTSSGSWSELLAHSPSVGSCGRAVGCRRRIRPIPILGLPIWADAEHPDLPGSLPQGLPDPASAAQLEALASDLRAAGLPLMRSAGELESLAADGFVYSPVLQPLLCGLRAQIGVRVQAPEEVLQVAAACSRHGVSLTVRGAATGNYGQCIPWPVACCWRPAA